MKDLKKRKLRIAVIDSGIDCTINNLDKQVVKKVEFFYDNRGKLQVKNDSMPRHIHGTIIASCIKEVCENVEFIDVNILDDKLLSSSLVLIKSLFYVIKLKPDIINLSLGTLNKKYLIPLKFLINILIYKKVLIVAAVNNNDLKTYPAVFNNVIGVKSLENSNDIVRYENGYFYSYGNYYKNSNTKFKGNSIATAYFTGIICKMISESGTKIYKKDLIQHFKIIGGNNNGK